MTIWEIALDQVDGDCDGFCQHIITINERWHRMLWIDFQEILAELLSFEQIDFFDLDLWVLSMKIY